MRSLKLRKRGLTRERERENRSVSDLPAVPLPIVPRSVVVPFPAGYVPVNTNIG